MLLVERQPRREKTHKKWRSTESDEDGVAFISARNESIKAVSQARADYKHRLKDELKSAPCKAVVKGRQRSSPSSKLTSILSLHVERTMIQSGQEKADALTPDLSKASRIDEDGVSPPPPPFRSETTQDSAVLT